MEMEKMYFIGCRQFTYFYFTYIFVMRLNIHLTETIVKFIIPEASKGFQLITSADPYSQNTSD